MSLTSEEQARRLWQGLDLLREILADTCITDHVYGPTSVSANIFTDMENLLTLSLLVLENSELLKKRYSETLRDLESERDRWRRRDRLGHEFNELEGRLRQFGSRLNHMADNVASLRDTTLK